MRFPLPHHRSVAVIFLVVSCATASPICSGGHSVRGHQEARASPICSGGSSRDAAERTSTDLGGAEWGRDEPDADDRGATAFFLNPKKTFFGACLRVRHKILGLLWRTGSVRHRINILVATILWRTHHGHRCATECKKGAPQKGYFLLVLVGKISEPALVGTITLHDLPDGDPGRRRRVGSGERGERRRR